MPEEEKALIEKLEKTAARSGARTTECYGVIAGALCSILIGAKIIPGPTHWLAQAISIIVPIGGALGYAFYRGGLKKTMLEAIKFWKAANKDT